MENKKLLSRDYIDLMAEKSKKSLRIFLALIILTGCGVDKSNNDSSNNIEHPVSSSCRADGINVTTLNSHIVRWGEGCDLNSPPTEPPSEWWTVLCVNADGSVSTKPFAEWEDATENCTDGAVISVNN